MKKKLKVFHKIAFFVIGIGSTIWFLIRVIPKPQRAAYPCMRASAPLASAFVLYVIGITGSAFTYKNIRRAFANKKLISGGILILTFSVFIGLSMINPTQNTEAKLLKTSDNDHLAPNQPIGEAKGIFPGRVVWVYNPDATDEEMVPGDEGDGYWESFNTDLDIVSTMLSQGIKKLTGTNTDAIAWDSIFIFHNRQMGKGNVGYKPTEKIFIKMNATSSWTGNINELDMTRQYNEYYGLYETTPQVVMAILGQLTKNAGVAQTNIYIGDPIRHIYQDIYDVIKAKYPKIHYLDCSSDYAGREVAQVSSEPLLFYSDKGKVLVSANGGNPVSDHLYKIFEDAEYILNIPAMKGHKYGGVTMFAKNNFGSQTRGSAMHLHEGLVHTNDDESSGFRTNYGMYRVLVDIMGSKYLGKKNLVYIMDALYSTDFELGRPRKFKMAPFNNDWTSSVFLSFDPVAIESVGFDFLYNEYDSTGEGKPYVRMGAVDDYLEQAADSAFWPDDVLYTPDGDGTVIGSLGTHEHWDSKDTKNYSRNLKTGDGIELVYINCNDVGINKIANAQIVNVYPNPFTENVQFMNLNALDIKVFIYSMEGKLLFSKESKTTIEWDGCLTNGLKAPQGNYLYCVYIGNELKKSGKLVYYRQ
jgi:hypothetical protein